MKRPGHPIWEKIKEVSIEIFIIVFAVTLSIGLHSWSDSQHEKKETGEFLRGLKDDLSNDVQLLQENKRFYLTTDSEYTFLLTAIKNGGVDTMGESQVAHHLNVDLRDIHANTGRYEGFRSSGKIGTIDSDSLKQNILVYYQQTFPWIVDGESLVNSLQGKILDMIMNKADNTSFKDLVKSFKMRQLLHLAIVNLEDEIKVYDKAEEQAKKIISTIDQGSSST